MNPVADRDDLLVRILDLAEQIPGQAVEPIGLAISAGKEVGNARRAQLGDRRRLDRAGAVGLEVALDRRRVVEGQFLVSAGLQSDETGCRSPRGELRDLDLRLHGELLVEDHLRGVSLGVDVQDQRRGELGRVLQLCCDMKKHEVKIARPVPNSETLEQMEQEATRSEDQEFLGSCLSSSVSTFSGGEGVDGTEFTDLTRSTSFEDDTKKTRHAGTRA